MRKLLLITSGCYSDYSVRGICEYPDCLEEIDLHRLWLEAVKRKTEYSTMQVERVATYLGIPASKDLWGLRPEVSYDKWIEAMDATGCEMKSEEDFFIEELIKKGFKKIEYEEFNTDD